MEDKSIDKKAKEDSKKIKELIGQRKLKEAIELTEKYPYDYVIQSQRISVAFMQNDLETAKEIAQKAEFKDKNTIYSQRIKIALLENNLEEADKLIKEAKRREHFLDARILASYSKSFKLQFKRNYLQKIINNEIEQGDIDAVKKSSYLDNYDKACMLLAYCDKTKNLSVAQKIYKLYESTNPTTNKMYNIRKIMQSIKNTKTKIFQYELYEIMLGLKKEPKKKKVEKSFDEK